MSARHFPASKERQDGRTVNTYRLTCGKCGCTGHIGNQSLGERSAKDLVAQKFERKGWYVGARPQDDRCPTCVATAETEARNKRRANLTVVKPIEPMFSQVNNPPAKPTADPPREMTRDERRIIFSKLDEVYLDEKRGYDNGWSDKRVASDLAVPQAWVAKIRDENFGAEKSNEEARELLAQARTFAADAAKCAGEAQAIVNQHTKLCADLAAFVKRLDKIERLMT